ncbi:hypothetical protein BMR03_04805 [Methylococcaceae bacterium HT2]|nr:hypothetical protein BMR03_04805 [Methylococcaceae bacterium HT2]
MEHAEYGKVSALLFLHSACSIQATLERRLLGFIKSAFLNSVVNMYDGKAAGIKKASMLK